MYEKIIGEINFIELIKKIKNINNEIKIIFILENKNENFEKELIKEKINKIIYINEININNLINEIKNITINNQNKLNEEIIKLNKIINEQKEEILKYKNNYIIEQKENLNETNKQYLAIIGEEFSGKTLIINNFKKVINNTITIKFNEININNLLEIEKMNDLNFKLIFVIETQTEKMIRNKKIINKLIFENKIDKNNIYIIFNKINKYSPNRNIAKSLYKEFRIIGKINYDNYCDFINNEKNNFYKENKKLKIKYNKIFNQII